MLNFILTPDGDAAAIVCSEDFVRKHILSTIESIQVSD